MNAVGEVHELSLPPERASVPIARSFGVRFADDRAVRDTLELLISELATNAVLHARTDFTVRIQNLGETIRVEVVDGSSTMPRVKGYDADAVTGRGLELVRSLSTRWGVDVRPDRKTVWFELIPEESLL